MSEKTDIICSEYGESLQSHSFHEKRNIITCFGCESEFEIVSINPIKLKAVKVFIDGNKDDKYKDCEYDD
jgi:hypothetical protein